MREMATIVNLVWKRMDKKHMRYFLKTWAAKLDHLASSDPFSVNGIRHDATFDVSVKIVLFLKLGIL